MYIAATNRVVSTVMVVERPEEGKERPVPTTWLSMRRSSTGCESPRRWASIASSASVTST